MIFRSPPSTMKATSRCTTYPIMSMIKRRKREKSSDDQTTLQVYFLFVFQEIFDDDSVQQIVFLPISLVRQQMSVIRTTYPKCNMIQRWSQDIWPLEHYWFSPKSGVLSLSNFLYFFSFSCFLFFLNWWPICSFVGTFFHNYNFVPHLCLYVFYLFFM